MLKFLTSSFKIHVSQTLSVVALTVQCCDKNIFLYVKIELQYFTVFTIHCYFIRQYLQSHDTAVVFNAFAVF